MARETLKGILWRPPQESRQVKKHGGRASLQRVRQLARRSVRHEPLRRRQRRGRSSSTVTNTSEQRWRPEGRQLFIPERARTLGDWGSINRFRQEQLTTTTQRTDHIGILRVV